jgi:hypothetical protein
MPPTVDMRPFQRCAVSVVVAEVEVVEVGVGAVRGKVDTHAHRQVRLTTPSRQAKLTEMVESSDLMAQTASSDPAVGLRGVASLRNLVEVVEELQVQRARELGWSWQEIAAVLGVSKQAMHQKYAKGERAQRRRHR